MGSEVANLFNVNYSPGQCHQNTYSLSRQKWSDGKENKQDDNMEPLALALALALCDTTHLEERGHSVGGGGVKS